MRRGKSGIFGYFWQGKVNFVANQCLASKSGQGMKGKCRITTPK